MSFTVIDATVAKGFGVATKNIGHQLPQLIPHFPDIKDVYHGSINVALDRAIRILKWDYVTPPVLWWDVDVNRPGFWATEVFGFLHIKLEYPIGGSLYRAWFFDCHNSVYHNDPSHFEIIAERIDGVSNGQRCRIHVEQVL